MAVTTKKEVIYASDASDPVWTIKSGGATVNQESTGTVLAMTGVSASSGWTFVLSTGTCMLMGLYSNATLNLPVTVTGLAAATTSAGAPAYTVGIAGSAIGNLLPGPAARRCSSLSIFVQTSTDSGKVLVDWRAG